MLRRRSVARVWWTVVCLAVSAQDAEPYTLESPAITTAADVLPNRSVLVVGQSIAGAVSNDRFTLEVGQVYGLLAAFKGDFDNDFDMDLNDLNAFVGLLLGQDADPRRRLEADLNGDGMVDGGDIASFVDALLSLG